MATKNCPHCSKQVPVACKKCVCGHAFSKRGTAGIQKKDHSSKDPDTSKSSLANSGGFSSQKTSGGSDDEQLDPHCSPQNPSQNTSNPHSSRGMKLQVEDFDNPPRRTGRVQREKPNFYDSLEYDRQIKKKIMLRRGKPKSDDCQSKTYVTSQSGGEDNGPHSGQTVGIIEEPVVKEGENKAEENEPVKKRRGRPPRITTGNINKSTTVTTRARIGFNTKVKKSPITGRISPSEKNGKLGNDDLTDDIMRDISPEQAVQFNIILDEINRKWLQVNNRF